MKASKILLFIVVSLMTLSSFAQGEDLIPFKSVENGKWGYKNDKGMVAINPQYDEANPFSEGIAVIGVWKNEEKMKHGMIDSKGSVVIEPDYDYGIAYHNGFFILDNYIVDEKGNYSKVKGSKTHDGEYCFTELHWLRGSNLAVVIDRDYNYKERRKVIKDSYLIRLDGTFVRQLDNDWCIDYYLGVFSDPPRFVCSSFSLSSDGYNDGLCLINKGSYCVTGSSGYGVSGYIDTTGKTVIKPQFRYAHPFSEGLASVCHKKDTYNKGYIDTNGRWAIKPQYSYAGDFKNGLAFAYSIDFVGFIDKKGNVVYDYTTENGRTWNSFIKGVDETSTSEAPVYAYWMDDGKGYIHYWTDYEKAGTLQKTVIIDEKGNVLYFEGDNGEKVDKDGNPIENREKQKPSIIWPYIPSSFDQSQFVLKTEIKSVSKIEYCKLYLNGIEVLEDNAPGGSAIVEDENNDININRTLDLREGKNTIRIEVKNAGGETDEEKTIEFKPEKAHQGKAVIVWNDLPTNSTVDRLELDATVKSTVKDVTCRVLLNGEEVLRPIKGSSIVEDSKEPEYKYTTRVQRMLTLKENSTTTIAIEVKDAQGGLLKSDQKQVYYSKHTLAAIKWGDVPSYTEEKHLTLRAQIISGSPIEYCSILKDEKVLKRVEIAPVSAPGGSSIVKDPKNVKAGYDITVEETVELSEGDNGFVIEVKNAGGILRSAPMTVKYKHKEKRIALVIGNQNYNDEKMRLTCPSNDANAVAARFRKLGFDEVMQMNNLNKDNMKSIINSFRSKSVNYDAVVVYYSGHGVQLNQINYMIPTDFDFSNGNVTNDCVAVTYILRDLGEDRMKIVVYDACRTQPRPKGDITDIDVMNNVNTFIAYASSVGQPSYEDIDSSYSIYTAAFLKVLEEPNLKLVEVFSRVNKIVRQKTTGMSEKQVPYIEGSIDKDFTFNKK